MIYVTNRAGTVTLGTIQWRENWSTYSFYSETQVDEERLAAIMEVCYAMNGKEQNEQNKGSVQRARSDPARKRGSAPSLSPAG